MRGLGLLAPDEWSPRFYAKRKAISYFTQVQIKGEWGVVEGESSVSAEVFKMLLLNPQKNWNEVNPIRLYKA